jgi:hypothetical protein
MSENTEGHVLEAYVKLAIFSDAMLRSQRKKINVLQTLINQFGCQIPGYLKEQYLKHFNLQNNDSGTKSK